MNGEYVNLLNIYAKQAGQLGNPLWSRYRKQGRNWLRGEVKLRNIVQDFQIVIEATTQDSSFNVHLIPLFVSRGLI